ncbi:GntR family transcriptional regulator [Saccharopolyspora antimicrobica]|uniref:GntR family transcriptional regulator n=1 Tax=Saccharopolyspora antimicrobica TaxID=455193 RepID=UPI00147728EE|nr:winged helix-turn-helix domain-containing protein [Saccharopolyspora antimicrobica]
MVTNEAQEDKRPASRRVADELQKLIDSGELAPGDPLPTYRQLAKEHDVAVNTAMSAVRLLRESGAVTIRPNAGARVSDQTEDVDVAEELGRARAEVGELRTQVQHVNAKLADLEERLGLLADRAIKG